MSGIVRKNLRFGGVIGALALLAACGGDDKTSEQAGSFPLAGSASQFDWPMEDPSFRDDGEYVADASGSGGGYLPDNWQPLPAARPMVASSGPRYDYAPSYDYYDDGPVYYDDSPSDDSYAWLALASMIGGTFGDAPPDYYFDYGDVEPWVWETEDHYIRYAEPLDDGYRYYYYEPYAVRPFLIRDPDYSYGYRDDRLVVIYDDHGRVLDGRRAWHQRRAAANYYARARSLHQHWQDSPRYGVSAPRWDSRRDIVTREQRQWDRARDRQNGWRNWDTRNERAIGSHWVGERAARQYAAQRFDGWRREDYRGPAPRFNVEARQEERVQQAALRQEAIRNVRDRAQFRAAASRRDGAADRGNWRGRPEAILAGGRDEQRQQGFFDRSANPRESRSFAWQQRNAERLAERGGNDRSSRMRAAGAQVRAENRQAQLRQRIDERRNGQQRDFTQRNAFFANRGDGVREQAIQNSTIRNQGIQNRSDIRERLLTQRQSAARGQDDARRQAQANQAEARRSTFAQRRAEIQQQRLQHGDRNRLTEQRQAAMRERALRSQAEGRQRMIEQRQAQMQERRQQAQQRQAEGRQQLMRQRQEQAQQRQAEGRQRMMQQRQEQAQQRQAEGRQRMLEQRQAQMQQRQQEMHQRQAEGHQRMIEQRQAQAQQRQAEGRQRMMEQRQAQMQQRQAEGRQQMMQQRQQEMQQRTSQRQAEMQQRAESRRDGNGNRWEGRSASFR